LYTIQLPPLDNPLFRHFFEDRTFQRPVRIMAGSRKCDILPFLETPLQREISLACPVFPRSFPEQTVPVYPLREFVVSMVSHFLKDQTLFRCRYKTLSGSAQRSKTTFKIEILFWD